MSHSRCHFITYADKLFEGAKVRITNEAQKMGFTTITSHGPDDIDKNEFSMLWGASGRYRFGFWVWKIQIINRFLNTLPDGEILFYADAGCTFNEHGIEELHSWYKDLADSPHSMLGFQLRGRECDYTTKQIFDVAGVPLDTTPQLHATFMLFMVSPEARALVSDIIRVLKADQYLITDRYSKNQIKSFVENRHDQSLFSVFRKKYGCIMKVDGSYWGDKSKYPIWTTRKRV